jgi:DNA-binding GntR family transcriptional regulator
MGACGQVGEKLEFSGTTPAARGQRMSDLAYSRILEHLFDRKLPAGAFVSQNDLVKLLGIPVAPLRDALKVLEVEGILTIQPRSGIQFVKPGHELTKSTYQFRTIVERAAARVYAEIGDEAEMQEIGAFHHAFARRIEAEGMTPETIADLEKLEANLHSRLIAVLGNPLIEANHRRMQNYLRLLRQERRITVPVALRSIREHLAIVEACEARDPDRAEQAAVAHLSNALQRYLGMYT